MPRKSKVFWCRASWTGPSTDESIKSARFLSLMKSTKAAHGKHKLHGLQQIFWLHGQHFLLFVSVYFSNHRFKLNCGEFISKGQYM